MILSIFKQPEESSTSADKLFNVAKYKPMLDKYQQAFVDHISKIPQKPYTRNILQAVAGSGKSTTVLHSILAILESQPTLTPKSIIATSFTNLASRELRNRYKNLQLDSGSLNFDYPDTGTIHTISYSILKRIEPEYKQYSIITEWQSLLLIRDNITQLLESDKTNQYTRIKREYNTESKTDLTQLAKVAQESYQHIRNNHLVTLADIENKTQHLKSQLSQYIKSPDMITLSLNAIQLYHKAKQSLKLLDYDDMIFLTVELLPQYKTQYQKTINHYKYIFIDEAQDCNTLQYHLITLLSKQAHLILVGDSCQSIYGFRDASPKYFTQKYLSQLLPDHEPYTFSLPINYRSTPSIITLSNMVRETSGDQIKAQPHREPSTQSVKIVKSKNNIAEANYIARTIKELLLQDHLKPKDITVIARSNRYLKTHIEPALINHNIQYTVKGGQSSKKLLDKPIAQFYLDCIQIHLNPNNLYAVINMLGQIKGIGKSNLTAIYNTLFNTQLKTGKSIAQIDYPKKEVAQPILDTLTQAQPLSLPQVIDNIITEHSLSTLQDPKQKEHTLTAISNYILIYEEQLQYSQELNTQQEQDTQLSPKDILQGILQDSSVFNDTASPDEITIATIHSQKGLESKVVFATGFLSLKEQSYPLEESNILYVQLSRAIDKLYITYPESYLTKDNETREGFINPYLQKLITKLNVKK